MPKLKDHLIPRLKDVLWESRTVGSHSGPPSKDTRLFSNETQPDRDLIYFKSDQIYLHKLARFQYTTYDLWRDQDVINPSTLHQDIVMLTTTKDDQDHPLLLLQFTLHTDSFLLTLTLMTHRSHTYSTIPTPTPLWLITLTLMTHRSHTYSTIPTPAPLWLTYPYLYSYYICS